MGDSRHGALLCGQDAGPQRARLGLDVLSWAAGWMQLEPARTTMRKTSRSTQCSRGKREPSTLELQIMSYAVSATSWAELQDSLRYDDAITVYRNLPCNWCRVNKNNRSFVCDFCCCRTDRMDNINTYGAWRVLCSYTSMNTH